MKNLKTFLLLAFISLTIISCNKDDDGDSGSSSSNFLKVGNKEYKLKAGSLEYYGEDLEGVSNFDVSLVTSNVTVVEGEIFPSDETFSAIYFELFTSNASNLEEGVYNFNTSGAANTFEYADIIIDATLSDVEPIYYEVSSGSFEVLDSGNNYNFKFQGKTADGQNFSGAYKGSLSKFDYSAGGKATTSRKNKAFSKK